MSAPKRIQQRRTKGWRKPEGAVAVGRGTKWGNPFRVGDSIRVEYSHPNGNGINVRGFDVTPEIAVALFRAAFTPDAEEIRAELAGKDLMCWCPLDQPCHADVLLELANPTPLPPGEEPHRGA